MSSEFYFRLLGMVLFGMGGGWLGFAYAGANGENIYEWSTIFVLIGMLVGLILTPYMTVKPVRTARKMLNQASAKTLFSGMIGLIISLVAAGLLSFPLSLLPEPFSQILPILFALLLSYLGVNVFISRKDDLFSVFDGIRGRRGEGLNHGSESTRTILMDTSVIIDGRVADIARTGFLSGELLIPRFVLNELQYIADSGDSLRRQRGRRGLEMLAQLQKDPLIPVRISDIDVEGAHEVDDKLVILAKQLKAPIFTNDFNLNRVAELQGVLILNINDLANAVKAVYLPGEILNIKVIQEGRESGQGVGYLDDGTMVVVQGGTEFIGIEIESVVTKVLQTAAGKMIFSRPTDEK